MTALDIAYRKEAAGGASGLPLLIALYDTLIGNLRRAAEAQRAGQLDARSKELKNALAVIGCLENWLDPNRGELAQQLAAYYTGLRNVIMLAQVRQSAELLEEQMRKALQIRQSWHDLIARSTGEDEPEVLPPAPPPSYGGVSFFWDNQSSMAKSWTA